jgi:ankyrin repeat protein
MYERILQKIYEGDLTAVKALVTENNYDVNTPGYYRPNIYGDKYPKIPLIIAATHEQNYDIVKFLLEQGADVNAIDNDMDPEDGDSYHFSSKFPDGTEDSALTVAALKGNVEIMKLLLDYDANVNHFNAYRSDSMEIVLIHYSDNKDLIHTLMDYGAYVNLKDEDVLFNEHVRSYIVNYNLRTIKEDLMAAAWHPKRLEKWLEYDRITTGDEHSTKTLDMMFGI